MTDIETARLEALAAYEQNEEITDDFDADPISDAFNTAFAAGWAAAQERAKSLCTKPTVCTCECGSAPTPQP
jgi:hypothetical protein